MAAPITWTDCSRCTFSSTRYEYAPGCFVCLGCGAEETPATRAAAAAALAAAEYEDQDEADYYDSWRDA